MEAFEVWTTKLERRLNLDVATQTAGHFWPTEEASQLASHKHCRANWRMCLVCLPSSEGSGVNFRRFRRVSEFRSEINGLFGQNKLFNRELSNFETQNKSSCSCGEKQKQKPFISQISPTSSFERLSSKESLDSSVCGYPFVVKICKFSTTGWLFNDSQ